MFNQKKQKQKQKNLPNEGLNDETFLVGLNILVAWEKEFALEFFDVFAYMYPLQRAAQTKTV